MPGGEDAWLAFHIANPPNSESLRIPTPGTRADPTYMALLRAGMNTDPDSYEEYPGPTFPDVIKADTPKPDTPKPNMPKPDTPCGNYSTKQGNLLIIHKLKQEGSTDEE